jgi:hypothetical protein
MKVSFYEMWKKKKLLERKGRAAVEYKRKWRFRVWDYNNKELSWALSFGLGQLDYIKYMTLFSSNNEISL